MKIGRHDKFLYPTKQNYLPTLFSTERKTVFKILKQFSTIILCMFEVYIIREISHFFKNCSCSFHDNYFNNCVFIIMSRIFI